MSPLSDLQKSHLPFHHTYSPALKVLWVAASLVASLWERLGTRAVTWSEARGESTRRDCSSVVGHNRDASTPASQPFPLVDVHVRMRPEACEIDSRVIDRSLSRIHSAVAP
ncbi:hypothetical protein FJTKL_09232 [Diaporthe vaccinii]|uniref:Uncharacterized protein n=1 Tax=Diaporthe vaccinii TaxID=105482 RepID=A0ABR4ENI3_9PEZI